jgi:putative tricarboxylic transport membrane protein
VPVLPFVIAFILAGPIERNAREAFSASGADPWFLFSSATSIVLLCLSVAALILLGRGR